MLDRNKVKALASYKEIVSQGYNDVSGKIQVKKGAFQFDKEPIKYSEYWHEAYRTYIVTSAGTVRALKGPASHVIANVDLNSLNSYDKGLKAILVDIEEFESKIKRRQELSKGREDYLQTILDKPLVVKKRIVSVFFIRWVFEDMGRFFGYASADEHRRDKIADWKKALSVSKETNHMIKHIIGGGYNQAPNKENVRIVKGLL